MDADREAGKSSQVVAVNNPVKESGVRPSDSSLTETPRVYQTRGVIVLGGKYEALPSKRATAGYLTNPDLDAGFEKTTDNQQSSHAESHEEERRAGLRDRGDAADDVIGGVEPGDETRLTARRCVEEIAGGGR